MNRKTLNKIKDLLSYYDRYTNVLNRINHEVTISGSDRDFEGKVCDTVRCCLDFEDVKPLIEKKQEAIKQELKELGFEEEVICAEEK